MKMRGLRFLGGGLIGALAAISIGMLGSFPALPEMVSGPRPPQPRFKKKSRGRSRKYGHPPNDTGWWRARAPIAPLQITEKMLMRHGWYRRQKRKEAELAQL